MMEKTFLLYIPIWMEYEWIVTKSITVLEMQYALELLLCVEMTKCENYIRSCLVAPHCSTN